MLGRKQTPSNCLDQVDQKKKKKQPVWSSDRDLVGRVDSRLREGGAVGGLPLKLRCFVPTTVMGHGTVSRGTVSPGSWGVSAVPTADTGCSC